MIHVTDEARQRILEYLGGDGPHGLRLVAAPG